MEEYHLPIQIRWSDLDPNFHLRHSVYYDWAALCRVAFFYSHGLSTESMVRLNFGPILLREEAVFRREIHMDDKISIDLQLLKCRRDYSRWTIRHMITKNESIQASIITVDGAWIDTVKRKLAVPPPEASGTFEKIYRSADFVWEELK